MRHAHIEAAIGFVTLMFRTAMDTLGDLLHLLVHFYEDSIALIRP